MGFEDIELLDAFSKIYVEVFGETGAGRTLRETAQDFFSELAELRNKDGYVQVELSRENLAVGYALSLAPAVSPLHVDIGGQIMAQNPGDLMRFLANPARVVESGMVPFTKIPFSRLPSLASQLFEIYEAVPTLHGSNYMLQDTLTDFLADIVGFAKNDSVKIDVTRENIVMGYALFVGFEANLLKKMEFFHSSPAQLASRYERLASFYGGDDTLLAEKARIAAEAIRSGPYGSDPEILNYFQYLIHTAESGDSTLAGMALSLLKVLEWEDGRLDSKFSLSMARVIPFFNDSRFDYLPFGDFRLLDRYQNEMHMLRLFLYGDEVSFRSFAGFFNLLSRLEGTVHDNVVMMPKFRLLLNKVVAMNSGLRLKEWERNALDYGLVLMTVTLENAIDAGNVNDALWKELDLIASKTLEAMMGNGEGGPTSGPWGGSMSPAGGLSGGRQSMSSLPAQSQSTVSGLVEVEESYAVSSDIYTRNHSHPVAQRRVRYGQTQLRSAQVAVRMPAIIARPLQTVGVTF